MTNHLPCYLGVVTLVDAGGSLSSSVCFVATQCRNRSVPFTPYLQIRKVGHSPPICFCKAATLHTSEKAMLDLFLSKATKDL